MQEQGKTCGIYNEFMKRVECFFAQFFSVIRVLPASTLLLWLPPYLKGIWKTLFSFVCKWPISHHEMLSFFIILIISAIEISGGNRSLVIKIIAQQIILRNDMSHINTSGYLENTLIRTNVSSLYKQHHQSKMCLQKFVGFMSIFAIV